MIKHNVSFFFLFGRDDKKRKMLIILMLSSSKIRKFNAYIPIGRYIKKKIKKLDSLKVKTNMNM